jgi:thymidylate kinase
MSVLASALDGERPPAVPTASLIDAVAGERVLVLGSFPPTGRDLDVAARAGTREQIADGLASKGFVRRGPCLSPARPWVQQWVRFAEGSAFAVDLHPPERWSLDEAEMSALFADAVPLPGMRRLARCAPHHVLLLAARGLVGRGGRLDEKRRRRVERALAEDPQAWRRAREHARAWGLSRALGELERAYRSDAPVPVLARAVAQAQLIVSAGPRPAAQRAARRIWARRPRAARVVSLSGLDGAGKSTQAQVLQELFDGVGVELEVAWMPLGHSPRHPTLRFIRGSASRMLKAAGRVRGRPAQAAPGANVARGVRQRSEMVTQQWVTIVALVQALQHRRAALRHAGTGKLVLFDRYILDSSAQLRLFYGAEHEFRFQKWLIRLVSPTPVVSFWLDVPPKTLAARKELQYSFEDVCLQWQLYQQELVRCRVERLDGERPRPELTEAMARRIWLRVGHE